MLGTRNDVRVLAYPGEIIAATTSGTDYLGPFYNDHFRNIRVALEVEDESGTNPALAWALEFQNPASLDWVAFDDNAGNQIAGVTFATTDTGLRWVDLHTDPLPDEDATAGVMTIDTNFKKYGSLFIPFSLRVALTLTGTGAVTMTYNSYVEAIG